MNQEGVSTESIVFALKNEHTQRHSQNKVAVSVSSTKTKPHTGKRPGNQNKKPCHCDSTMQMATTSTTATIRAASSMSIKPARRPGLTLEIRIESQISRVNQQLEPAAPRL
ncbi:hypothetical protein PGT21_012210 [Puccinia graminis f. sp. tritici]|uniref:Uncharacterized protein n=1 Tax=Puccinia graminis f. sp. tritici TaxID=56615 RepID=A0A5B0MDA3_PUCGR|nr:hypothetical protein PGT21_012210 [Puccinia graminis f. sp. tritici]